MNQSIQIYVFYVKKNQLSSIAAHTGTYTNVKRRYRQHEENGNILYFAPENTKHSRSAARDTRNEG
jgi:predicted GIY-YIG superfamily endonuclease